MKCGPYNIVGGPSKINMWSYINNGANCATYHISVEEPSLPERMLLTTVDPKIPCFQCASELQKAAKNQFKRK